MYADRLEKRDTRHGRLECSTSSTERGFRGNARLTEKNSSEHVWKSYKRDEGFTKSRGREGSLERPSHRIRGSKEYSHGHHDTFETNSGSRGPWNNEHRRHRHRYDTPRESTYFAVNGSNGKRNDNLDERIISERDARVQNVTKHRQGSAREEEEVDVDVDDARRGARYDRQIFASYDRSTERGRGSETSEAAHSVPRSHPRHRQQSTKESTIQTKRRDCSRSTSPGLRERERRRDPSRDRSGKPKRHRELDERSRSRERDKKRRKKEKRREKEDDGDGEEKRSVLTGKKIKLKVKKDKFDRERDANRKELLQFLNSAYE